MNISSVINDLKKNAVYQGNSKKAAYRVSGESITIILTTKPCSWYAKSGCSMCGYPLATCSLRKIDSEQLIKQFD